MSSAARKGALTRRYIWTKFYAAGEEFVHALVNPSKASAAAGLSPLSDAVSKFKEAYTKQMTTTMYIAGTAMCPSLNRKALKDSSAIEKLVVRLLPRPSSRSVWIGDVVAYNSPLGKTGDPAQVMVRRVAAVEGMQMVAEESDDQDFTIPPGHCWVLADNPDMKPPQVIDSRTFGFIPMSNIVGRVIYSGSSSSEHAPVTNSPLAQLVDDPVLEQEVDVVALYADMEGAGSSSKEGQQQE